MPKFISPLMFAALTTLLFTFASAQEKKPVEPPQSAMNSYQELLYWWTDIGGRLTAMAEDFPEDKYNFKAQKDERTFGDNLLHVAAVYYVMMSAIKGTPMGHTENEDSLRKIFPTKADIVKFLKQSIADGADLIKAQGDSGLTREFKYPWANQMVHGSFGWWSILWHTGDHYGQLVVYYRLNGMIPPASRPKK
ncbi:MAG: DinB family protein [Ignavibacteriales bacterium]|nr:DinB family protein [Ignavibacteriales bacterium]